MKISLKRFSEAVEELRKKKIYKSQINSDLELTNQNSIYEILSTRQKLTPEILTKFCEKYGYRYQDFVESTCDLAEVSEGMMIGEPQSTYDLKDPMEMIRLQFDTVLRGQEKIREIISSSVGFIDIQTEQITQLKKVIGV